MYKNIYIYNKKKIFFYYNYKLIEKEKRDNYLYFKENNRKIL